MPTNVAHRLALAVFASLPAFGVALFGLALGQVRTAENAAGETELSERVGRPAVTSTDALGEREGTPTEHAFSGWQNCHFCHGGGTGAVKDDNEKSDILVALDESIKWRHEDRHFLAARVLIPDEQKRNLPYHMQQALGAAKYRQVVKENCQACHVAGEPEPQNSAEDPKDALKLPHEFGITCEACHGAAKDWIHPHWEERKVWRYKSPAQKEQAFGLINLRNPVTKAHKCLSCHLGNVHERKIVTHEMYAAGHPPLPGFDVATFSLAMPVHWTAVHEKPDTKYKASHRANRIHAANTREVLLGSLAALAGNLQVVSDYAASPAMDHDWPEFALYDCFACHHDLNAPGRRPLANPALSRPGRPPLRVWPEAIARLALEEVGPRPEVERALSDVANALGEQPFGQRDQLQKAAAAAADLVDQQIELLQAQLDRSKLSGDGEALARDRELVERTLNSIAKLASSETYDYDSARQLVWAFQRVYDDYKKLNARSAQHDAVDKALTELNPTELKFDLTKGQQPLGEPPTLAALLEARSAYDPRRFAAKFAVINELTRARTGEHRAP